MSGGGVTIEVNDTRTAQPDTAETRQRLVRRRIERQKLPNQLRLPLGVFGRSLPEGVSIRPLVVQIKNPNLTYEPIGKYSGPEFFIAQGKESYRMFTILKLTVPMEGGLHLFETNDDNVIGMQECLSYEGSIFCVYDTVVECTLEDFCAAPVFLDEPCLATIFQDLLNALIFVATELQTNYGRIDKDYVVIERGTGRVRLLLATKIPTNDTDSIALGNLLVQVINRESGIQVGQMEWPRSKLRSGSRELQDFIQSTETKSCAQLLQVMSKHSANYMAPAKH